MIGGTSRASRQTRPTAARPPGAEKDSQACKSYRRAASWAIARRAWEGPTPSSSCRTRKALIESRGYSARGKIESTSLTWAASRNFKPPYLTKGMLRRASSTSSASL